MNPVFLLIGVAASALGVACLPALILNVAADCDSLSNLLFCVGFTVLTAVGAVYLKKAFDCLSAKN